MVTTSLGRSFDNHSSSGRLSAVENGYFSSTRPVYVLNKSLVICHLHAFLTSSLLLDHYKSVLGMAWRVIGATIPGAW